MSVCVHVMNVYVRVYVCDKHVMCVHCRGVRYL